MQTLTLNVAGLSVIELVSIEKIEIAGNATIPSVSFSTLTNVRNVEMQSNPVLNTVSFPQLKSHTGGSNENLNIASNAALTSINLNSLQSSTQALGLNANPQLTTLQLGALVYVNNYLSVVGNSSLASLVLPSLVTVANFFLGFLASNCTNLQNVSFPKYLPTKGKPQNFDGCALTEASVDHILSRCVASANYTTGAVNLSGGTSATPGAQGQLDKATLIARGCTVLTN